MGIASFLIARSGLASAKARGQVSQEPPATVSPAHPANQDAANHDFAAKVVDRNSFLASDDSAWLEYLRRPMRTFRHPGLTLQAERKLWMEARARSRGNTAVQG